VNQQESLFPEIRKRSGVYAGVSPSTLYTFCHPVNRGKGLSDFGYKHGARCKLNFNDGTEIGISVSNHIDFIRILFQVKQSRPFRYTPMSFLNI
jgi:hypothetical protein